MSNDSPFRKPTPAEFEAAAALSMKERHKRVPSKGGRVAAFNELHRRVANNAALYEDGNLQDQRDAVADSLIAVQEFMRSTGFALATIAPIMRPVEAIVERENNALDPLFCERPRTGRPKAAMKDHERTGILAAIAEAWLNIHENDDLKQSLKLAGLATTLTGSWFGKVTAGQLKSARDLVLQEANDHLAVQHARLYYKNIVMTAETFGKANAIPIMVRFLNDTPATFGFGKRATSNTPPVSPIEDD